MGDRGGSALGGEPAGPEQAVRRDRGHSAQWKDGGARPGASGAGLPRARASRHPTGPRPVPVSYTHLRAHET